MVTKGIIKSIDLLGNTCTVHIPFFETAGNDPIIETATVSNTPGSYNGYKVGDAVYVAFEDGNMSTPVIIGKLYLGTEKEKADPRGVSNVEESTATKKATLPADSKLTAQIDSNVPNTTVPYSSLSSIANGLNTLNTNVGQMDRDYGNRFKQVISNAEGLKSEIEQTAGQITNKVLHYVPRDEDGKITKGLGWELTKDHWVVKAYDKQDGIDFSEEGIDLFKITRSSVESNAPEVIFSGYPRTTVVRYAYGTDVAFPALYGKKGDNCGYLVSGDDPLTPNIIETQHHIATLDEEHMNLYEKVEGENRIPGLGNWSSLELPYKATIKFEDGIFSEDPDGNGDRCYVWEWTQTAKYVYDKGSDKWTDFITDKVIKLATTGSVDAVASDVSQTKAVVQGKSTNYYSVNDPSLSYTVKSGDCWFKTIAATNTDEYNKDVSDQSQGKLYQCSGFTEDGKAIWEDIGGELVANKLTANYINALDIIAKKIDVGNTFSADAATGTVSIGGFEVDSTQLKSNNENLILNGAEGKIIAKSGEIGGLSLVTDSVKMFNDSEIKTTIIETKSISANTFLEINIVEELKSLDSSITEDDQVILTSVTLINGLSSARRFTYFTPISYSADGQAEIYDFSYHNLLNPSSQYDKRQAKIEVSYFIRPLNKTDIFQQELVSSDKNFVCTSNELHGSRLALNNFSYNTSKGNFLYSTWGAFGSLQFKNGQISCNETAIQFINSNYNGWGIYTATITPGTSELYNSIITIELTPSKDQFSTQSGLWYDYTFPIRYKTKELGDTFLYDTITVKKGNLYGKFSAVNNYQVTEAKLLDWTTGEPVASLTFNVKLPYVGDSNVKVWPETVDFNNSILIKNANIISKSDFMERDIGGLEYSPYTLGTSDDPWGEVYSINLVALGRTSTKYLKATGTAKFTGTVYHGDTQIYDSDINIKNNILSLENTQKYEKLFDSLRPVSYKLNNVSIFN